MSLPPMSVRPLAFALAVALSPAAIMGETAASEGSSGSFVQRTQWYGDVDEAGRLRVRRSPYAHRGPAYRHDPYDTGGIPGGRGHPGWYRPGHPTPPAGMTWGE